VKQGLRSKLLFVFLTLAAGSVATTYSIVIAVTRSDPGLGVLIVALAVGLAQAALLSSLWAHSLTRSVRGLTATARAMAAGDLGVRTAIMGADELGDLGRALDQLARNLAAALDRLRREHDLLNRVLNGMREGVLLLDRQGRVVLANSALRDMLLLGPDVVGKSPLEVIRNAELKRTLDEAAASDDTVSGEIDLGDLKRRQVLVHAAALRGQPGGGLLAVFVDMTDLRRLETIRRDFVANVSHELRTPIATVRSAAETLRSALATRPDAAPEFVAIIERQSERLHWLVEDLLDLARIESKQFRLALEPVSLAPVVDHILSLFRERAHDKRIHLAMEIDRDLPSGHADRRALEQVLSNLLDNAVKYGTEGASVTVRAAQEADNLRVSIHDTGVGIDAQHLPRLFERFYRVDPGRSRDVGGTGLGLSIVKHLVEAMDGRVGVESAPGEGTTFSFTLPTATLFTNPIDSKTEEYSREALAER
jgi:two-component system, OmpR family, phosphate regulon sensor histidine kinase PhoR